MTDKTVEEVIKEAQARSAQLGKMIEQGQKALEESAELKKAVGIDMAALERAMERGDAIPEQMKQDFERRMAQIKEEHRVQQREARRGHAGSSAKHGGSKVRTAV